MIFKLFTALFDDYKSIPSSILNITVDIEAVYLSTINSSPSKLTSFILSFFILLKNWKLL